MVSFRESSEGAPLIVRPETTRLKTGDIYATDGAVKAIESAEMSEALGQHVQADWGDVGDDDKQANDRALKNSGRLVSSYRTGSGTKFWIITEADRSSTTILLPSEY